MGKLALVLAGGGSLGSYEVGAIEALEELGYKFDIVTGTSIGAINGAFVCNGQTKALRGLWEAITPEQVMADGINLSTREINISKPTDFLRGLKNWTVQYLSGKNLGADISPFKELVKASIDVDACYQSSIEYGIVTTKFPSMKLVDVDMHKVKRENFLAFIHASSACFPIFPIEKIEDVNYVDGFYKDNLPIRLAFNMGADEVIAIDMRLFSLEPQNKFYLSLPNVTYIAPYINFGSLMDFDQSVLRKNMALGYYDVMKHYKKLYGFKYNFKPFQIEKGFLSYILKDFETDSKHIVKLLSEDVRTPMTEEDYYIRALELVAEKMGIEDYYTLFTFDEFKELIRAKIIEKIQNESRLMKGIREGLSRAPIEGKYSVIYNFLENFTKLQLGIDTKALIDEHYLRLQASNQ